MKTPSNRSLRTFGAALSIVALASLSRAAEPAPAPSAEQPAASTGIVTGRVFNAATKNYLGNVEVRVDGTAQAVYTDSDGYFRLSLPTGSHLLVVSYDGLTTKQQPVVVQPGKNAVDDIGLTGADYGDVVVMEEFVVATEKEGRAASIAQQKRADNNINVVSSDEFPNVTSGSIGDFLQNMPGIAIDYSGSDPRSIRVRGMDPNMGSVTVDGMRAANAASGNANRVFEIDQISLQNVESIEVTKAPTAANDADQGGGNVNLVSKSAFKTKGRRISYGAQLNMNSQNMTLSDSPYTDVMHGPQVRPGGNFSYMESFKGRFGVAFNVNWYEFFVLNQQTETNYNPTGTSGASNFGRTIDQPNGAYVGEYIYSISPVITRRQSVGLNLDYRLSDTTTLWVKGQVSPSYIGAAGRGMSLSARAPTVAGTDTRGDLRPGFDETHQEVIGTQPTAPAYNPYTSTSDVVARLFTGENLVKKGVGTVFSAGIDQRFGRWTINYAGSVSLSTNRYDLGKKTIGGVNFYLRGLNYNLDTPLGSPYPTVTQITGPDIYDLSSYVSGNQTNRTVTSQQAGTFTIINARDHRGKDKLYNAKVDAKRDFSIPYLRYVKTGASFRQQERDLTKYNRRRWAYVGPDGIPYTTDDTAIDYGQFQKVGLPDRFLGNTPPIADLELVKEYFVSHPNEFREDLQFRAVEALNGAQSVTEKIFAGYVMSSAQFGSFNLLTGVRYERTEDKGEGVITLPANAAITDPVAREVARLRRTPATNVHNNWFPNVQGKYTLFSDLVARAAFTRSIGRQNFGNIIPGYTVTYPTGSARGVVNGSNPDLEPVIFTNYEVSLEYYLKPVGVLSIGAFRKNIRNYTKQNDTIIATGDSYFPEDLWQYDGYLYRRRTNAGDARIQGFELNYSQQLSRYAAWLQGVQVFANYTQLESQGKFTYGGTAELNNAKAPLENFVPITYNVGASYNKKGLRLSLKYNYKGQYLENLGEYRWWKSRGVFDFFGSYEVIKNHALFVDIKNIGNQPLAKFEGTAMRTRYYVVPGATINVGVQGKF